MCENSQGRRESKDSRTRAKESKDKVLIPRRYLRGEETETATPIPLVARADIARAQPPIVAAAAHAQQVHAARKYLMHDDEPIEAHLSNLFVREHPANEAGQFQRRHGELPLIGIGADVFGKPFPVLVQFSLENTDFVLDLLGRFEFIGLEKGLGVTVKMITVILKPFDPLGTGGAVGLDGETDDTVFLCPAADRFRENNLSEEKTLCSLHATELVEHGLYSSEFQLCILHSTPFRLLVGVAFRLLGKRDVVSTTATMAVIAIKYRVFSIAYGYDCFLQ